MPPDDLYALIINVTASADAPLRQSHGRLAHAMFFNIVEQVDPALAALLHAPNSRRPFTVSPLVGFGAPQRGRLHVRAGQCGWLRVTLFDRLLFETFIAYFLQPGSRPVVRLAEAHFLVTEILTLAQSDPWAGSTTLAALWDGWEAETTLPDRLMLEFCTPTSFNRKLGADGQPLPHRQTVALPLPEFVFGGLATLWDLLTGQETTDAVRAYALDYMTVGRHQIETVMVDLDNGKRQVGFVGPVTFELLGKWPPALARHIQRLADLAFYTGVGSKTTHGMGQVRLLERW